MGEIGFSYIYSRIQNKENGVSIVLNIYRNID